MVEAEETGQDAEVGQLGRSLLGLMRTLVFTLGN